MLIIENAFLGKRIARISAAEAAAGLADGSIKHFVGNLYRRVKATVVKPTLKSLSISNKAGQVGAAFDSNVVDATDGSTLVPDASTPVPAGVTFDGITRQFSGMPSAAGSFPMKLVETLAGAVGSPKTTDVGPIVIAAAANPAPPPAPPPVDPAPCDPPAAPPAPPANGKKAAK